MAFSAVLGSPPPCGSCWQVQWYWLPWVCAAQGQALRSAHPGVQLEGTERKKCGQRALGKDQRDGNKTFCSLPSIFMRVASGRVCFPRPHPVFFQREISQAELLSMSPLMKQGGSVTKIWEPMRPGLVDGRTVPRSNKDSRSLLKVCYCLTTPCQYTSLYLSNLFHEVWKMRKQDGQHLTWKTVGPKLIQELTYSNLINCLVVWTVLISFW